MSAALSQEPPVTLVELPEQPLVTIRSGRAWSPLNLRELWGYRELLYFLTWRDVKVRYKQAALGAAWAVIQPLSTMLIFSVFFGRLAKVPSNGIPYPLFSYAALLPWTFFANAISNSANSLVGGSNLITKVYFPRLLLPASEVAAGLVDFAIAFVVFIGMFVYYRVPITNALLLLPVLIALTTTLALGVGLWMAAINVKYRDVRYALPFLIQLWLFASPVIYPSSLMPERWRWVLAINPMTGIIEGYRSALLGQALSKGALAYSALITFAILVGSAYSFRRMEKHFADVV